MLKDKHIAVRDILAVGLIASVCCALWQLGYLSAEKDAVNDPMSFITKAMDHNPKEALELMKQSSSTPSPGIEIK